MSHPHRRPRWSLRRATTVLALAAAAGLAAWLLIGTLGDADRDDRPPTVTLADVVADPHRFDGRTVVVSGRIRDRTEMSYELTRPGEAGVLLVRRQRPELRPHARRGDRIEVIGVVRASAPVAPDGVVAELVADEVLLHDRADKPPREL